MYTVSGLLGYVVENMEKIFFVKFGKLDPDSSQKANSIFNLISSIKYNDFWSIKKLDAILAKIMLYKLQLHWKHRWSFEFKLFFIFPVEFLPDAYEIY